SVALDPEPNAPLGGRAGGWKPNPTIPRFGSIEQVITGRRIFASLAIGLCCCVADAAAQNATPPDGFTALFNGQNLDGWHGRPHVDPAKLAAMTDQQRADQLAEWTEEARQHWSVDDGVLVNDGKGPY